MKIRAVLAAATLALAACQWGPRPGDVPDVRQLALDGTSLAYVDQGRGEPVVFVHGIAGDWRTWEELRPYIAGRWRFVAYSRRYHWPNEWRDQGQRYTAQQHAEDLAAFIRSLGAGKVHLVGGSAGGRFAAEVALKHPDLVRTLVLSDPNLVPATSPEARTANAAFGLKLQKLAGAARGGDGEGAVMQLVDIVYEHEGAWKSLAPQRQRGFLDNQRTMAPMLARPSPAPGCDAYRTLRMPVLLIEGERTLPNFRLSNQQLLSCLPPGSERAVVAGAQHIWYWSHPAEGAAMIDGFLRRRAGG